MSSLTTCVSVIETEKLEDMCDECNDNLRKFRNQLTLQPVVFVVLDFITLDYPFLASVSMNLSIAYVYLTNMYVCSRRSWELFPISSFWCSFMLLKILAKPIFN